MNKILLIIFFFFNSSVFVEAQNTVRKESNDTLSNDPELKIGKLSNGFTYYIKKADPGSGKVHLRLVVKAGSIQEDDDQLDQAHVLEHVAFQGSKNFPEGIFQFTDGLGVKKGNDVNAHTATDCTNYLMTIPANETNIDTAIAILGDISDNLLITPSGLRIEGEAVMAEVGNIGGLGVKTMCANYPKLLGHSRYAKRGYIPNRTFDNLFNRSALLRFYNDWYRPNLEALIIVGDIQPDDVEASIIKILSHLKNPMIARPRIEYPVFVPGSNQLIVFSDQEIKDITVRIYNKHAALDKTTIDGLRQNIISRLYEWLTNSYIKHVPRQYNSEILLIKHDYIEKGPGYAFEGLNYAGTTLVIDSINQMKSAIQKVYTVLNGIKLYGFAKNGLTEAKIEVAENINRKVETIENFATACENHFVYGHPVINSEILVKIERKMLEEVTLTDVNSFAKKINSDHNRDIEVVLPTNIEKDVPVLDSLEKWMASAKPHLITNSNATHFDFSSVPLNAKAKIIKRSTFPDVNVQQFTFSNGVNLILKSIPGSSDKIFLNCFSKIGAKTLDKDLHDKARQAATLVMNTGISHLNKFQLEDYLNNKKLTTKLFVDDYLSGINASVSRSEGINGIESLLKVILRFFTSPVKNQEAYSDWKRLQKRNTLLTGRGSGFLFDTIKSFTGEQVDIISSDDIDTISYNSFYEAYQQVFGDASTFTFVITGDFDIKKAVLIFEKYIGTLPVKKLPIAKNPLLFYDKKPLTNKIYGEFEYPEVMIRFAGKFDPTIRNRIHLSAIRRFLDDKLTKRLREKEKGIYVVGVGQYEFNRLEPHYIVAVNYKTTLDNLDRHLSATKDEINKFKHELVDKDTLKNYIQSAKQKWENELTDNSFWNNYLSECYLHGKDFKEVLNYSAILDQLTPASIQAAANNYLDDNSYIEIVGMPESGKAKL